MADGSFNPDSVIDVDGCSTVGALFARASSHTRRTLDSVTMWALRRLATTTLTAASSSASSSAEPFASSWASAPVGGGSSELGDWQRLSLVELDGPRERTLSILAMGSA